MDERARWLSGREIAAYCTASAGSGFYAAFNNAALPLLIPSSNALLVNLLSSTRSIEGTVVQPLVGAWSDRTWTRLGRRRPFMLVALPISALFMALTPFAPGLLGIVACIVLFSLFFNVASDPYTALQADIAPPAQRTLLNGVGSVVGFAGQVALGLFLGFGPFSKHLPPAVYFVVAAVILVTWLYTTSTVREQRALVHLEPAHSLGAYLDALRQHRQAFRYLVALFFYNIGLNTIVVNLTRYATHVLHTSDGGAFQLFLVLLLVTGLFTLPATWLANRFGVKRILILGMAVLGTTASGALFVQTAAQVLPLLLIAGIGNSAVSTLTWPLMMQLVPTERTGVFAGLKTSAESVSAFFSAFLAFEMVNLWGYRSIFLVLTLAAFASLALLLAVRTAAAEPEAAVAPAL